MPNDMPVLDLVPATSGDEDFFFECRNDQAARMHSGSQRLVSRPEHAAWYRKKLCDRDAWLWVICCRGEAAGVVRLDSSRKFATVSISLADDMRGRGIATQALMRLGQTAYKVTPLPLLALIRPANEASIKSFSRAGFNLKRRGRHFQTWMYYPLVAYWSDRRIPERGRSQFFQEITGTPEQIRLLASVYDRRIERISSQGKTLSSDHERFVKANPYRRWFLLRDQREAWLSVYVTYTNTVGIVRADRSAPLAAAAVRFITSICHPLTPIPSVRQPEFVINLPTESNLDEALKKYFDVKVIQKTITVK